MISFVWSSKYPFYSGTGGSENYTAGQIRELKRRGIEARIITLGHGKNDGREDFPDIDFHDIASKEELSDLDDTLVFITYPLAVKTKRPSYVILHCPPPKYMQDDDQFDPVGMKGKRVITTSRFALRLWAGYYAKTVTRTGVVYPFADDAFAAVQRSSEPHKSLKILFAGRLTADKGIYTLLAALHMSAMRELDYTLTATTAGIKSESGRLIAKLLRAHPLVKLVPARRSPAQMARLMAEHDIVVMPSSNIFWQETFGMLSVEAQHAGCRVVASKTGGIPETDCGGLLTVKPDNPLALAEGLVRAAKLGPLTAAERDRVRRKFTIEQSVNALLRVMNLDGGLARTIRLHEPLKRLPRLPGGRVLLNPHSKRQIV